LNIVNHLSYALHHLVSGQNLRALCHELGYALAIAGTFQDKIRDQRYRFGVVEPYPAL
jgi:hypothetical protein